MPRRDIADEETQKSSGWKRPQRHEPSNADKVLEIYRKVVPRATVVGRNARLDSLMAVATRAAMIRSNVPDANLEAVKRSISKAIDAEKKVMLASANSAQVDKELRND